MTERLSNRFETELIPETEKNRRYALISVSDKTGIVEFASVLNKLGYLLISTGGTARALSAGEIPFIPIQDITGNPEAFEGRMKTISFPIEGGILYDRSKPNHVVQAQQLEIPQIDIVVCNLYPFETTIANPDVIREEAIENIDVGGPTMVRAAAKNHKNVLVVVDSADYLHITEALLKEEITNELRQELAAKAFGHLAFYDAQIARYLGKEKYPQELTIPARLKEKLRYGDNPDQQAFIYFCPGTDSPLARLQRHAGRELSATNITDIGAGINSVRLFDTPAAVVIKHNTPCGLAKADNIAEALTRALESDPVSAFGGVVVLNSPMTEEAVNVIVNFKKDGHGQMDIIATPQIDSKTIELLIKIRKSTGIYTFGNIPLHSQDYQHIRTIEGGLIIQKENDPFSSFEQWSVPTDTKPTLKQLKLMQFAWVALSRIRSNTVAVIDKNLPMTRGIGTGQTSRVLATEIALSQAGKHAQGAILASDSFFPFPDSVRLAGEKGISAIIQQGGSVNDQASIDVANKYGITMVVTGQRLFWH